MLNKQAWLYRWVSEWAGLACFLLLSLGMTRNYILSLGFYIAPAPLFILTFLRTGVVVCRACALTAILIFICFGLTQFFVCILTCIIPAIFLSYALHHQAQHPPYRKTENILGLLLLCMGGAIVLFLSALLQIEAIQHTWKQSLWEILCHSSPSHARTIRPYFETFFFYLPSILGLSWTSMILLNVGLCQKIFMKSAHKTQIPPLLCQNFVIPSGAYWLFALSLACTLMPQATYTHMAKNLLVLSCFPFIIEGFVLFHFAYSRLTQAPWGRYAFYALTVLLIWPLVIPLLLGLFEPWINLRKQDPSDSTS